FRRLMSGRAAALLIVLACAVAPPALGQTERPRSNAELVAALDPLRSALDAAEQAMRGAGSDQALADVAGRGAPLREQRRAELEAPEPRLGQVDTRIKQLGDPPPATAPPEDPALAAERKRLTAERGELDAALKQARLLALRAEQLNERISEHRRNLLAGRLLVRSAGLIDAAFWREAVEGAALEAGGLRDVLAPAGKFPRTKIGAVALVALSLLIAACAVSVMWLTRAWRRRIVGRPAETRFARALAALITFASVTLIAPAVVIAAV